MNDGQLSTLIGHIDLNNYVSFFFFHLIYFLTASLIPRATKLVFFDNNKKQNEWFWTIWTYPRAPEFWNKK